METGNSKVITRVSLFIAGAAMGGIAGLLLAPESGKETRRKVSHWLHWLKEKRAKGKLELLAKKDRLVNELAGT